MNETLEQRVAERSAAAEEHALAVAASERALQTQTTILKSILDSMGDGVVVLQDGWQQKLEGNKQAFAAEFVARDRFTADECVAHDRVLTRRAGDDDRRGGERLCAA